MNQQPAPTEPTPQPGDRILITHTVEPGWDDEYDTDGQEAQLIGGDSTHWYEVLLDSGKTIHVHRVRVAGEAWLRYERDLARHALAGARQEVMRLRTELNGYQKIALDLSYYISRFDVPDKIRADLKKIRYPDD